MKEYRTASHVMYDIKYHVCWITKYRREVLKGEVAKRAKELIQQICGSMDIKIIVGSIGKDHVHLLVSVPPRVSVSKMVQRIKGGTSRKLQQEYRELKKEYWGQHLWARGYFVVSSGNVTDAMWKEYIENQGRESNEAGDFQIVG